MASAISAVSSDYRGSSNEASGSHNQSTTTIGNNRSYKNVAESYSFPKKNQAIILEAVDGITIKEYTVAVGNVIEPRNILFVSSVYIQ